MLKNKKVFGTHATQGCLGNSDGSTAFNAINGFYPYGPKFRFTLKKTIKNNAYIFIKRALFDGELAEMC
jgi:hypothetical protein